jgi:hypothetical protein
MKIVGTFFTSGLFIVASAVMALAVQPALTQGPEHAGTTQTKTVGTPHDSVTGGQPVVKVASVPDKTIMFFMNPNGRPCQVQLEILDGMQEKLAGVATIKYVKTTVSADQSAFYKYGIRGLPFLIILDKNGKELKRFTPGIQDEATILSVLKSLK